jgi:hypothetical protein
MVAGEGWLTPQFLGRKLLVKPPLAMWVSAASRKLGATLRLPHAMAAAGIATLVYAQTGPVGWTLLVSRGYWRERAGLVMMDDLLVLFYGLALWQIVRDTKFKRRRSAWFFGALVGLAVMTKWFAGGLPLLLLLWTRPPWKRVGECLAAAALVAMPWHLYQLVLNRDWFLAEYVGVELLTYALDAPVQATQENRFLFYGSRMAWLLPLLAAAGWAYWRKSANSLVIFWCGILGLATLSYGYRNASYLLPMAPALLMVPRFRLSWHWLPVAAFYAFGPGLVEAEAPGDKLRGHEVLHLDATDQLRTSLASGATVRYVFFAEHLPPNGPLDFEKLGIAKSYKDFLTAPGPEVDAVLAPNLEALRELIERSPQRDFLLPGEVWKALRMRPPHDEMTWPDHNDVWLLSRAPKAGPRPNPF